MPEFGYDPALLGRFPTIVGGVISARVDNGPTSPELREALAAAVSSAVERIGDTPLSEVPSLAAWRRVFRGFGVDPTQYRSQFVLFSTVIHAFRSRIDGRDSAWPSVTTSSE